MRLLALIVLVLGFLIAWGDLALYRTLPEEECPPVSAPEYGYTFEAQWWPPGTRRCVVIAPDGEVLATGEYFPLQDYLIVVLWGLAVAVLRLRPLRVAASLAMFLAGLFVFFVGW
jgi:predicted amidohydrolase